MILSLTLSTSSDLFNRSKPIVTLERELDRAAPSRHLIELVSTAAIAAGLTAPEPDPSDPDTCEEGERTGLHRKIRELELAVETERRAAAKALEHHATELDKVAGETEARVREELAEKGETTPIGTPPTADSFPHGTILEQSPQMRWIVLLDQDQVKRFHYIGGTPDDSSFPHKALGAGPWKVTRP